MKNKNTSWFSIVMALLLTIVMVLLVLYILEYIIPYSKNVKSIENSSNAFYQAESAVEDRLFYFKTRSTNVPSTDDFTDESVVNFGSTPIGFAHETISNGWTIPPAWQGNSAFDISYNTISTWNPIQIEVWDDKINSSTNNLRIEFQTPDIDNSWNPDLNLTPTAIINWQLSWINDTLNAELSWITAAEINLSTPINLYSRSWKRLDWIVEDFGVFYTRECDSWKDCTLKLSIINSLETTLWIKLPYLEYQINTPNSIPLRFSRIVADWKSYGFQKSLEVRVPQQTTNEAFDFTVFQ